MSKAIKMMKKSSQDKHQLQINKEYLHALRHSTEHVLTYAMQLLYGREKIIMAMGPATEDGFYFDFDSPANFKISESNFPPIEKQMKQLIKANLKLKKLSLNLQVARQVFQSNPYKQEWLAEIEAKNETATVYLMGTDQDINDDEKILCQAKITESAVKKLKCFIDLCKGPHVKATGEIKAFKLLNIAGAYWHGDEKNKMLTRIYGTTFMSEKELDNFLKMLAEAKKRDHRRLGQDLDLFSVNDEVGKGLILWHPKLAMARHQVEELWKKKHLAAGYHFVNTPHIGSMKLFTKTRHYSHYINAMFPVMMHQFIEGESAGDYSQEEQLKPMNCPFHCAIFNHRPRSYRELPFRMAELGTVYRYERSGQLHGMTRVRGFTQDDSHIFCSKAQAKKEVLGVIKLTKEFYDLFGFKDFKAYLSTMPEKHLGLPAQWQFAEKTLAEAIKECHLPYQVDEGEGAFYGPKIDFKVKDSMGREWQLATVQWDFNLPSKAASSAEEIKAFQQLKSFRYIFGNEFPGVKYSTVEKKKTDEKIAQFIKEQGRGLDVTFINEKGEKEEVVMIHRVILGALERFFGVLIEHYGGAFPVWMAPVQVVLIPIADKQAAYAEKVSAELKAIGIRVENWQEAESMQKKIRRAEKEKVPYMLVLGEKEAAQSTVAVRGRGNQNLGVIKLAEFIEKLLKETKVD